MPTQNNDTKDVVIQHYNNFSEQSHSTLPPTYEQSTNPQYLPSPNLNDILQGQEKESFNYKNDNIGPSSPSISLLNPPIPSAPPMELILDNESSSPAPPPPVANPDFRSNALPNSHPNSSSPNHIISNPVNVTSQTNQTEPKGNFDNTMKTLCNYLRPIRDKRNWIALIYLIVWDLNFGVFSFMWIMATFCISIPMMIIPPIGCFLLTWSVRSWRALAHIEILVLKTVCSQSDSPQKLSPLPPVYIQRKPGQGCFSYLIQLLTDSFTVRCFAYFVLIRPWASMLAALICLATFIIGINVFWILPIFMPLYRDIVNLESKLGKRVLVLENNDANENVNEEIATV